MPCLSFIHRTQLSAEWADSRSGWGLPSNLLRDDRKDTRTSGTSGTNLQYQSAVPYLVLRTVCAETAVQQELCWAMGDHGASVCSGSSCITLSVCEMSPGIREAFLKEVTSKMTSGERIAIGSGQRM